jgi:hypothetical protein
VKVKLERIYMLMLSQNTISLLSANTAPIVVFCSVTHYYRGRTVMSYNTSVSTLQEVLEMFPSSSDTFTTFKQILGHTFSFSLNMHFLFWRKRINPGSL